MTKKILYIKLTNGQELVASCVSGSDGSLEIESDAAVVFLAAGEPGHDPIVNLAPFAPFTDDKTLSIDYNDILFSTNANDELSTFFKRATGKAAILTPPSPTLIGIK